MATQLGSIYYNLELDVKQLKKDVAKANKTLGLLKKGTDKTSKSFTQFQNDIVRTVRRLETLVVAGYGLYTMYNQLIGAGIELNKQYEDQALGIAALTSAKTEMVTATGEELNSYEKFIATQAQTKDVMDDIKKSALDTPASFQQMVGFYQQAIGHAMSANGTFGESLEEVNENTIEFTKRMSALGSAAGMDMNRVNEEIRSLMSGNASTDSLLAMMLFGSPSGANKAVKAAKQNANGLSTLLLDALEPFKHVEGVMTYSKAMAQLGAAFDDIKRTATGGLFEDMKFLAIEFTDYFKEGLDRISTTWLTFYDTFRANIMWVTQDIGLWEPVLDEFYTLLGNTSEMASDLAITFFKTTGMMEDWEEPLSASETIMWALDRGSNAFLLGIKTIQLALISVEGIIDQIGNAWNSLTGSIDNQQSKLLAASKQYQKDLKNMPREAANSLYAESRKKILKVKTEENKRDARAVKIAGEMNEIIKRNSQAEVDKRKAIKESYRLEQGYVRELKKAKTELEQFDVMGRAVASAGDNEKMVARITKEYMGLVEQAQILKKMEGGKTTMTGGLGDPKTAKNVKKTAGATKGLAKEVERLAKAEERRAEAAADALADYEQRFADAFGGAMMDVMDGDLLSAFEGFFNTVSDQMMLPFIEDMSVSLSKSLSDSIGSIWGDTKLGSFAVGGLLSFASLAVGSLLSDTVSQADIDAAKGETDFSDDSINNLIAGMESVQYPLLKATYEMDKHLRSMDNNFVLIAKTLTGNMSNIDVTGSSFVETHDMGFLGFSSKDISLISTGLSFELQTLSEYMDSAAISVKGYTTTLEEESSWFGFVNSSSIETDMFDVPDKVKIGLSDAFTEGYKSILVASATLGLDSDKVKKTLSEISFSLGSVDLEGLDDEGIADRLNKAIGGMLSEVVDIIDIGGLVQRYSLASEEYLETFVRIAVEFEQATHSFMLIGRSFAQMSTLDIVGAIGGLDNFNAAMGSFTQGFYGDAEQMLMLEKSLTAQFKTLGVVMPKTNAGFRQLIENFEVLNDADAETYANILSLSGAFAELNPMLDETSDSVEEVVNTMSESISAIASAWTGNLSYLSMQQKTDYASGYLALGLGDTSGAIDTVEAARLAAETAIKTTATKEEYIPIFERYIAELETQDEDATNTDLLDELKLLRAEVSSLREATYNVGAYA